MVETNAQRLRAANPDSNQLRKGARHDALLGAVTRSGYPLETIIAARLKKRRYYLQEEWPYTDSDTGEERTLDLEAGRQLGKANKTERGQLGVYLNLLIECKVWELPYVAFESVEPPRPSEYPSLTGGPRRKVDVYRETGGNTFQGDPCPVDAGLCDGAVRSDAASRVISQPSGAQGQESRALRGTAV